MLSEVQRLQVPAVLEPQGWVGRRTHAELDEQKMPKADEEPETRHPKPECLKSPCAQIVDTLGPMYLCREYFKAKVCTIWVHGP